MTNRAAAIKIIKTLHSKGFEALLAGGCVRDMLLKRPAKDYDVATDATADKVMRLFRRTLNIGAKFGVVVVLLEKQHVEVATFRTESGYVDGRHPESVKFSNAKEDASRRDFTVNGMFYEPIGKKVIDYVNGQSDLKKGLIRTIGNPNKRFSEDYLRMLRAIRFSTQLKFKIEPKTFSAICKNGKKITRISAERITAELEGILVNPNRGDGIKMLLKSGLAHAIFPEITDKQFGLGGEVLGKLPKRVDFPLALSALFSGCDTDIAVKKVVKLKLSKNQNKHVKFLLGSRGKLLNKDMSLAKLKLSLACSYFEDLFQLQKAIQKANNQSIESLTALRKRINSLGGVELKPKPLLNGHELMQLGALPGPVLGQLMQEMYIAQLEGSLQTKKQASQWTQQWLLKHRSTLR